MLRVLIHLIHCIMLLEAIGQHHLLVSVFIAMFLFGVGPFVECSLPLVLR